MKKQNIKIAVLALLPLIMIATIYYFYKLRNTFYDGRTRYFESTNPVLVTIDPSGQPWVLDNPNDAGTLRTLEGDEWVDSLRLGWASSMVFDHHGNVWIDGQNGLYKIAGKQRTSFKTGNSGLASDDTYHLAVDNLGRVWITYNYSSVLPGSGVTVFDGTAWTTFTTANSGLISNEVTTVAFDAENRAWIGTTEGMSTFDGTEWVSYSYENSKLVAGPISSIAFDQEGRAWIGTASGINIFDGKEWVYYSLEEIGIRYPSSLSGTGIFIDPLGRIWIQNNGDVRIFDGKIWIGLAEDDGYNNNVFSLASDKQGNIWLANGNDRGLVLLNSDYPLASAWRTQPARIFLSSGGLWYVAFILACLCIAILSDTVVPVVLALLSGIASIIGWMALFKDPHLFYVFPLPFGNPGIYATLGATLGVFTDIRRSIQAGTDRNSRFAIIGFYVGWAIGLLLVVPFMFAQ